MFIKIYNKVAFCYLAILLTIIQIFSILISYQKVDLLFYSYFLMVFGIVGILIYGVYKYKNRKISIKDIFIILLGLFAIISYLFSYDKYVGLWGFINRREGLLVILSYYSFFLVSSTLNREKFIKWFVWLFSLFVIVQLAYGFLQIYDVKSLFGYNIVGRWKYAFGLVGNSNFMSSLVIIFGGIWLGHFFLDNNNDLFNGLLVELFLIGLVMTGAMSGFVAFLVMMLLIVVFIIYLAIKKREYFYLIIKTSIVIFLFIFTIIIFSLTGKNDYVKDIFEFNNQVIEIADKGVKDEYGTGRMYIWRKSFEYLPKHVWNGIGIDQFYYIAGDTAVYDRYTGNVVDKAHNEYLQILVTEGVFKALTYIIFLGWIFFKCIKCFLKNGQKEPLFVGLFMAFVGYSIQAFFNISITRVAPIFFMVIGLLFFYIKDDFIKKISIKKIGLLGMLVLVFLGINFFISSGINKNEVVPVVDNNIYEKENELFKEYYDEAEKIMENMSIENKVSQLFIVRYDVPLYGKDMSYIGGFTLYGTFFKNRDSALVNDYVNKLQAQSKIKYAIAVDEEGGTVSRISYYKQFRNKMFESPNKLYKKGGMKLILKTEDEKDELIKSLQINLNLAPVADVSTNKDDFMYDRTIGKNAKKTASYIEQVTKRSNKNGLSTCLKHFPGFGNNKDTHHDIVVDERTLEELRENDFLPFKAGIDAGTPFIMVSHHIVNSIDSKNPASMSKKNIDILRDELGFTGIIMTDDIAMNSLREYNRANNAAITALLAGNDMIMTSDYGYHYNELMRAYRSGVVSEKRINYSVKKIIAWKLAYGIIESE